MIVVRRYRDTDFGSVDRLWAAVFPDDPPRNHAAHAIPARLAIDPDLLLVAESDGTVVATIMAGYDGHRGWLYALAVDPERRRLGIATLLVRDAEQRLAQRGCIKVNLQVRADNSGVTALYEALGYEVEPRISMGRRLGG